MLSRFLVKDTVERRLVDRSALRRLIDIACIETLVWQGGMNDELPLGLVKVVASEQG